MMIDTSSRPGTREKTWTPPRRGALILAIALALSLIGITALALSMALPPLWAHASFFAWATAVAINLMAFRAPAAAPATPGTSRARLARALASSLPMLALAAGLFGALACLSACGWCAGAALPSDRPETVRMVAILSGVAAFVLFFLGRWAHSEHRQSADPRLASAIHITWLGIGVHLAGAVALFFFLYSGIDLTPWTARAIAALTAILVADAIVGMLADIYRPAARRGQAPPGRSALLDWTLSRANPVRQMAQVIEANYGVRLGEIWALRFLRDLFPPLVALGALMVWGSSCFTIVPAESQGVRIRMGQFHPAALQPGLHAGWPWPFERIAIVPTRRIETIHLGYDEDLGGPILWDQRHYRGEKNMLAGSGEELLTVSVLLFYRIADPVAHLLNARGHAEALTHMAYRELVHVLAARESFGVMIGEREEIAEKVRRELQSDADRFGLGIEVLFVGLRDIHPPVDVAPAYQDVISAEEERHAIVYGGHKYRALNMPAAEATANKKKLEAQSKGEARVATATGEANKFREIVSALQVAPEFLRERLRLEALEETLPGRPKLVIDGDAPVPAPALFYLPLDPGYSIVPVLDDKPASMQ